jgi:hypothetical protein
MCTRARQTAQAQLTVVAHDVAHLRQALASQVTPGSGK